MPSIRSANRDVGIRFQKRYLLFNALLERYVVRVHSGDVFSVCALHKGIQRPHDFLVLLVLEKFYARIFFCQPPQNRKTFVGRTVIGYEDFEIFVGLIHYGTDSLLHIFFCVVARNNHRHQRQLILCAVRLRMFFCQTIGFVFCHNGLLACLHRRLSYRSFDISISMRKTSLYKFYWNHKSCNFTFFYR